MAAISGDLSRLTPTQLELAGRIAFSNDRLGSFWPYLLGLWVDALCLGAVYILFARWCLTAHDVDRPLVRALVYWLVFITTATSAWLLGQTLTLFVIGFGEYAQFLRVDWVRWSGFIIGLSRVPASFFFTHRAWMLSGRKWWVPATIVPLILGIGATAIATPILVKSLPYPPNFRALVIFSSVCEVVSDMIITTVIGVQLRRSKTGWTNTNRLVSRLLRQLVETQTPPLLIALALLILVSGWPNTTHAAFLLWHPKAHVICILIVLIARVTLRDEVNAGNSLTGPSGVRSTGTAPHLQSQSHAHAHSRSFNPDGSALAPKAHVFPHAGEGRDGQGQGQGQGRGRESGVDFGTDDYAPYGIRLQDLRGPGIGSSAGAGSSVPAGSDGVCARELSAIDEKDEHQRGRERPLVSNEEARRSVHMHSTRGQGVELLEFLRAPVPGESTATLVRYPSGETAAEADTEAEGSMEGRRPHRG